MFDEGSSVHVMKEKKGEYPYGDIGQAVLLGVFLAVCSTPEPSSSAVGKCV
jgi:hypothetical protein